MNVAQIESLNNLIIAQPDAVRMQVAIAELLVAVREVTLTNAEDNLLERYIRYIQLGCTELMDQLYNNDQEVAYSPAERTLVGKALASLLDHLQKYYPAFYDVHLPLPAGMVVQEKAAFQKAAKQSYARLKSRIQDQQLLAVIDQNNKVFLVSDRLSSFALQHQQVLDRAMTRLCTQDVPIADFDRTLVDHLIALNYQDPAFVNYYMEQVARELGQEASLQTQVQVLQGYRKRLFLISISVRDREGQCQENNTLELLSNYVLTLLEEKRAELTGDTSGALHVPRAQNQGVDLYKIKVSFSADVLAYLTRLYLKCGFMVAGTRTELFNFLAARVQTAGIKDRGLSASSLGVKYRQVVHSTATQTRAMLMKMIKEIDLEFK